MKFTSKRFFCSTAILGVILLSLGFAVIITRPEASAATITSGDLIKGSRRSIYYYGADGKRYIFPNERTFKTWYSDFSAVMTITDTELGAITIGGNVTFRPGVKMVKITTDPKVYAVAKGGVLRWIETEAIARSLYGTNWNRKIDDVSDEFFTNYVVGQPINSVSDFDKNTEMAMAPNINVDKNLDSAPAPEPSPEPAPVPEPIPATGSARIFYTDLVSGPNTGGEGNAGAFVTIWGKNFGSSRGTSAVTVGGGNVQTYKKWSDTEIIIGLGPEARSGNIVVATSSGGSNGVPFTVRAGNIYFVATNGNDQNSGSFAYPWRTILKAKDTIAGGDIAYIMNGVSQTGEDNFTATLSIETSGASSAPKALVAYPGATATIGSTGLEFGIRVPNIGIAANDWVFSKLVLRGGVQAMDIGGSGSKRWRIVGNDISCPSGDGQTGCFAAALASNISFLGNNVHDISKQRSSLPSKQYHAVYFTTDTNHVEVGWNHIHDNFTCRALQFHSSPLEGNTGYNQFDLSVHDNLIHGDVCDGINFATVDPSKGAIRVWNNIIYDVGRGPSPPDGDANYACIYVAGGTNTGTNGSGNVEIFNNTLYNCGARGNSDSGALVRGDGSSGLIMLLKNNLILLKTGEDYIAESASTNLIRGNNNLWFGVGSGPSFLTGNINADPRFRNVGAFDFHLLSGSPAIDAGVSNFVYTDFDGISRPTGAAHELGAFEFVP